MYTLEYLFYPTCYLKRTASKRVQITSGHPLSPNSPTEMGLGVAKSFWG